MNVVITSMGTASPGTVSQAATGQLAKRIGSLDADRAQRIDRIYAGTRIETRGSVVVDGGNGEATSSFYPVAGGGDDAGPTTRDRMARYAAEAAPLGTRAAEAALARARLDRRDIGQLVAVSCTGFHAPGLDIALVKALGLPPTVGRTLVGFMGCHGALNGLRVAGALAGADPSRAVLLCAVELCSLHYAYAWNMQRVVANALFADGAAAAVVRAGPTEGDDTAADDGSRPWRVLAHSAAVLPDSEPAMGWHIGDHGFEMTLARSVPGLIREHLRPFLETWLAEHGRRIDAIGSWAIHPGGPKVIDAVAAALDLADTQLAPSLEVLRRHGNMSSPTLLFILDRLRRQGAPRPAVALGFGPGLSVEAALLD